MLYIGFIILAVGGAGAVLTFAGAEDSIPVISSLNLPFIVWAGIAAVGAVMVMFFRRARD